MLRRCSKCTVPITCETVSFDENGVCNICRNWQKKNNTDWISREKEFLDIIEKAKKTSNSYDCIVPFSGGKDSTFTLWVLVKKYSLRPLVVSFDHGFYRPIVAKNRIRTFRKLGVDVLSFTPNWKIVKKIMLESLIRKGDFCWHCHAGIFAYPVQIAIKFDISLVIWGEGGGEYEDYFDFAEIEETDEWKFNRRIIMGMRAEDMAGFINVDIKELSPYIYPNKEELDKKNIRNIPLGKYMFWDVKKQVEIIKKELGWQEDYVETAYPGAVTYEKIECMMQGCRDYIKFIKRGYSRLTHLTSIDIRHGRMDRETAIKLIKDEAKRPVSLDILLNILGLSSEQFNQMVLQHVISPFEKIDTSFLQQSDKLLDQDTWFIE